MKRKRVAKRKKPVPVKSVPSHPTVVNENAEAFANFVAPNVQYNPPSDESNDFRLVVSDSASDSSSSSSSSSSNGSDGSQDVDSGSDESASKTRVKKSASKRGRPRKGNVQKQAISETTKSFKGFELSSGKGKQSKNPHQYPQYNKKELKASFAVIKKVMEMDEAVPFSSPVDPVSLGIPQYNHHDVMVTPMDFGTILCNLQKGIKYLNSADVFKDIQHIWEHCRKYNKKGDYIVYLMKRVKKKFMKYWTVAGLHGEKLQKSSGKSHLEPSNDRMMRSSRHEAISMVNRMAGSISPIHQDNFATNQTQPQVPPQSHSQLFQLPQSHSSNYQQFSQPQAGQDSNYAGPSNLFPFGNSTTKQKKHAPRHPVEPTMAGQISSRQGLSQPSSYCLLQSPQCASQPQPSQSHVGPGHSHLFLPTNCAMGHNVCGPGFSVDPMLGSVSQLQPVQNPLSHSPPNDSDQPRGGIGQCQPSEPPFGRSSCMPLGNGGSGGRVREKKHLVEPRGEIPSISRHSEPLDHNALQAQQRIHKKKRGVRGPTRCRSMWYLPVEKRILVPINALGQPVGAEASKLSSFLGTIARNGTMAPLTFVDWREMPDENKEDMWQFVQARFDIDPQGKSWVLKSLASKWRNWKAKLKADHYYPHKSDEERLKDCDERVLPDQWPILISHWNSEEARLRCEANRANRANQKSTHAAGSKSYARIREEERAKMPSGKEPTRAELYILTHTRKDGLPMNEMAAEVISKLREQTTQKRQTSNGGSDCDDTFVQVMGEEKRSSYVRMYGLGPTAADFWGSKPSHIEPMKMAMEAKKYTTGEVQKMLAKMEAMEEKYACMEAQIARINSNMQSLLDKLGVTLAERQVPGGSNAHEDSLQAQVHSSSSSHAILPDEVGYGGKH